MRGVRVRVCVVPFGNNNNNNNDDTTTIDPPSHIMTSPVPRFVFYNSCVNICVCVFSRPVVCTRPDVVVLLSVSG